MTSCNNDIVNQPLFCIFFSLSTLWGCWDLISPTRDWTWATAVKVPNPNHGTIRELPLPPFFSWSHCSLLSLSLLNCLCLLWSIFSYFPALGLLPLLHVLSCWFNLLNAFQFLILLSFSPTTSLAQDPTISCLDFGWRLQNDFSAHSLSFSTLPAM